MGYSRALGDFLAEMERGISEYWSRSGTSYRTACELLAATEERLHSEFGKQDGSQHFREWAREQRIADNRRSEMLRVARTLPPECFPQDEWPPESMQVALSQAAGKVELSALIADAKLLSVSDFRAKYLGKERRPSAPVCWTEDCPERKETPDA